MHRLQVWLWANSARHGSARSSAFCFPSNYANVRRPTTFHCILLYFMSFHVSHFLRISALRFLACIFFPSSLSSVLQPFFDFSCSDSFRCVFLVLLFFDFFVSCCRHLRFLQQTWQVHEEEFAKLVDNLHRLLVLWCLAAFSALTNDAGVSGVLKEFCKSFAWLVFVSSSCCNPLQTQQSHKLYH